MFRPFVLVWEGTIFWLFYLRNFNPRVEARSTPEVEIGARIVWYRFEDIVGYFTPLKYRVNMFIHNEMTTWMLNESAGKKFCLNINFIKLSDGHFSNVYLLIFFKAKKFWLTFEIILLNVVIYLYLLSRNQMNKFC